MASGGKKLIRPELEGGATVGGVEVIGTTGVIVASSVAGAFDIGTDQTFVKGLDHTIKVSTSTVANETGKALTVQAAKGDGTGSGGVQTIKGGDSGGGATGAGGAMNVTGGAAASTNGDGGSVNLTGGAKAGSGIAGVVFTKSLHVKKQGTPTAKTVSATLTAAELLAGIVTVNQAAGGTSALQLPTGTAIQNALPAVFAADDAFDVSFINTSTVDAEDASVTVNTDVTIVGSPDFPAHSGITLGSQGIMRFRKTADHVFVAYRIA